MSSHLNWKWLNKRKHQDGTWMDCHTYFSSLMKWNVHIQFNISSRRENTSCGVESILQSLQPLRKRHAVLCRPDFSLYNSNVHFFQTQTYMLFPWQTDKGCLKIYKYIIINKIIRDTWLERKYAPRKRALTNTKLLGGNAMDDHIGFSLFMLNTCF